MTSHYQRSVLVHFILALLVASYAYYFLSRRIKVFGIGTIHKNANTTGCYRFGQDVQEIQGCESIHVDPRTSLAYMACGNRATRLQWVLPGGQREYPNNAPSDHVFAMDTKNRLQIIRPLEFDRRLGKWVPFSQDFRVHGFDIYWDDHGPAELTFMFVNHQRSGSAISIFRHMVGTAHMEHVKTVRSPLLYSPNDVVALSRQAFYATNDVRSTNIIMRNLEIFLGMPWGRIVYYDGGDVFTIAVNKIPYPNGITRSADGRAIYVSASSEPSIREFRPTSSGTLVPVRKNTFRTFVPDNISVDSATGELLVAGFLNTFEALRYMREVVFGSDACPAAAVYRLRPQPDPKRGFSVEGVLTHNGTLLPTATMATVQHGRHGQRILLGSVMGDAIAICDVDNTMA